MFHLLILNSTELFKRSLRDPTDAADANQIIAGKRKEQKSKEPATPADHRWWPMTDRLAVWY